MKIRKYEELLLACNYVHTGGTSSFATYYKFSRRNPKFSLFLNKIIPVTIKGFQTVNLLSVVTRVLFGWFLNKPTCFKSRKTMVLSVNFFTQHPVFSDLKLIRMLISHCAYSFVTCSSQKMTTSKLCTTLIATVHILE